MKHQETRKTLFVVTSQSTMEVMKFQLGVHYGVYQEIFSREELLEVCAHV